MRHRAGFALLLALAPTAAHSEWAWRYPLPQGHTLNDVAFLTDSDAIAVGEFGTVLVSHDAGQTWAVSSPVQGIETSLTRVDRLDANTAIATGENGIILRTTNSGSDWTPIPSGTSSSLLDISFADASNGIIVAGNEVLRTNDGGLTWASSDVPFALRAVDAVTATLAFAGGVYATVMTTSDGGETWTPMTSPIPPMDVTFTAIDFIDAMHGVIASATGYDVFLTVPPKWHFTVDGGATWTTQSPLPSSEVMTPNEILYPALGRVLAGYTMTCCALSAYDLWPWGNVVLGSEIPPFTQRTMTHSTNGIARNDAGVVLAVGEDGMIMRSVGGGFSRVGGVAHRHHDTYNAASSFADPLNGVVISGDAWMYPVSGNHETHFARTADGGLTWTGILVPNVHMADLVHMSTSELYAVGVAQAAGAVLHSTNGGGSWSTVYSNAAFDIGAIAAGSPTHAVAAAGSGRVLVIANGSFTLVTTGLPRFEDVAFASPLVVVGVGSGASNGRSIDGGLTWTPLVAPAPRVRALDFATATIAFGTTSAGIVRSDDVGSTWVPVPSGVYANLRDIDFADADHGVAVGEDGLVLITSDGGLTWLPQDTPTNRDLDDATALSSGNAFVSGPQQILLEYYLQSVPTLISSFDVEARPFSAELHWSVHDDGSLSRFSILRRTDALVETIAGDVASAARSFVDQGLVAGQSYEYQLVAIDQDGSTMLSAPISVTIPRASLELLPNQPNPFNPSTRIGFVLPAKGLVRVDVFDAAGHRVATLVNDVRDAGVHSVDWNAIGAASGVYFCRLQAGKESVSRKMVLLK